MTVAVVGQMGGTSLGMVGWQHQVVDVVVSAQVGGHHQRGVDGARSLGAASNSSLDVVHVGQMGGTSLGLVGGSSSWVTWHR